MSRFTRIIPLMAIAAIACDSPSPTAAIEPSLMSTNAVDGSTTGGGHYLLQGALDVQFAFSAIRKANGTAMGQFHQRVDLDGTVVDFHGRVTCVAVDPVTGRAWVGGVITQNRSTDPAFTTAIHQPGKDVWFRVVDYGEGSDAPPDRTTFLGFEGGGGIFTSEEYCRARIWPADDARTWPVTSGNIQVR